MGWSIGFNLNWNRDIGYGVPAECDFPDCKEEIDRGLSFVCGAGQPYGGDNGCGLYFCGKHQYYHSFRGGDSGFFCIRCVKSQYPFKPKPDVKEWIDFKLKDKSWDGWRKRNPDLIKRLREIV